MVYDRERDFSNQSSLGTLAERTLKIRQGGLDVEYNKLLCEIGFCDKVFLYSRARKVYHELILKDFKCAMEDSDKESYQIQAEFKMSRTYTHCLYGQTNG